MGTMAALPPWLPGRTARLIEETVLRLEGTLGQDLVAAFLVGVSLSPARQGRERSPEIVALCTDRSLGDVARLGRALAPVMRKGARLRLLTESELRGSCDVFALELSEWKARHCLLHGADPLTALTISRADLRHSLETELRGLSRRMRNRVLTGLATDRHRDDPQQAVLDGIERLVVISRHALALLGGDDTAEDDALLRELAVRAGADPDPLLRHLFQIRHAGKVDPAEVLAALLQVVQPAAAFIDALRIEA